jgi:rubrerythrin
MNLQSYRILAVTGALAAVACNGPGGVTTPDVGPGEPTAGIESAMFAASVHEGELPPALVPVLDAERLAVDFYEAVVLQLEVGRPFSKVAQAEVKHVDSLEKLYTKRSLPLPDPPDSGDVVARVATYTSLSQACADAADHERLMDGQYEGLLQGELPDDVAKVLGRLKTATSEGHLPAFEMCAGA